MTIEPLPRAIDAEHLTLVLRRSGALRASRVCDVAMESSPRKLRSHTSRLRLTYDRDAGQAPRSLILKTGHLDRNADPSSNIGDHDVVLYTYSASLMAYGSLRRCLADVWEMPAAGYLLLE